MKKLHPDGIWDFLLLGFSTDRNSGPHDLRDEVEGSYAAV